MSEDLGSKLAAELAAHIAKIDLGKQAVRDEIDGTNRMAGSLEDKLSSTISGFNKASSSTTKINMETRPDRWELKFGSTLMLTLKSSDGVLRLVPSKTNAENPSPSEFAFFESPGGFKFQGISANPTIRTPMLDQDAFVSGIVKMSCGRHFDAT
jgi:hypothetical protein